MTPTSSGANAVGNPVFGIRFCGVSTVSSPKTSAAVAMASLIRLATGRPTAGPVEKTASFAPLSSVSSQCGRKSQPHQHTADECADDLRKHVGRHLRPFELADRRESDRHGRIQVRAAE